MLGRDWRDVMKAAGCHSSLRLHHMISVTSSTFTLPLRFTFLYACKSTVTWCVCVFSSIKRSNCYMVWAGESSSPGQGRNNNGLEIGCLVDTTNGLLTFTANGKELSTYYQVNIWYGYRFLNGPFHFTSYSKICFLPSCLVNFSFLCIFFVCC